MDKKTAGVIADESGAIALIMALLLVVFMGTAALVVDYGYMSVVQNQLKKAAEAGALAGALALGSASSPNWSAAETAAESIVEQNYAGRELLTDCTVTNGYWSTVNHIFQDSSITPTATDIPAIKVMVAKSSGNNGGPLNLSFAPILGIRTVDLSGTAIAMITATSTVTGGWGILEIGNGNVSVTGAVASNGSVGVNGDGKVTVSGSGSISGNLYVNGDGNVTLSGAAVVDGSVWVNGDGKFTMSGSAAVKGVAYLDNDLTQSYGWSTSINGHSYQGGSGFQSGDISNDASGASAAQTAATEAQTAYDKFSTLPATDPTSSINLSGNKTQTIIGTKSVNVLNLSTLILGGSTTLYLNAPANESFVINVSDTFSLGGTGSIVLQGGLTYENVTFVNTGTSTVSLGGSSKIKGNILSPKGAISLSGAAQYSGSLVGGKDITLSGSVDSPVKIPWLSSPSGASAAARAYLVQ